MSVLLLYKIAMVSPSLMLITLPLRVAVVSSLTAGQADTKGQSRSKKNRR